MTKLTELTPPDPPPGLVEMMERVMESVMDGTIRSIVVVGLARGGEVHTCITGEPSPILMVGALEVAKMRVMMEVE